MAHRLLFPLATLFTLVAVPLWIVFWIKHPSAIRATWHGHEMLFGLSDLVPGKSVVVNYKKLDRYGHGAGPADPVAR